MSFRDLPLPPQLWDCRSMRPWWSYLYLSPEDSLRSSCLHSKNSTNHCLPSPKIKILKRFFFNQKVLLGGFIVNHVSIYMWLSSKKWKGENKNAAMMYLYEDSNLCDYITSCRHISLLIKRKAHDSWFSILYSLRTLSARTEWRPSMGWKGERFLISV